MTLDYISESYVQFNTSQVEHPTPDLSKSSKS